MVIKNLTAKPQSLEVVDFKDGREFSICIQGYGITDLQGVYLKYPLASCFESVSADTPAKEDTVDEDDEIIEEDIVEDDIEDTVDEDDEIIEEDENDDPEVAEDKFICDICGQEFASARGLNSHKNRVHVAE